MSLPVDLPVILALAIASVGLATITQAIIPTRFQMGPLSCGYCLCVWYGIAAGIAVGMLGHSALTSAAIPCWAAIAALLLIRVMPEAFSD